MTDLPRIGVFAPASPVGEHELAMGVAFLRGQGFEVRVHDQARAVDFIHAGTDTQRADALWELANDEAIDAVWCARGGYGCNKLPAVLDALTKTHGPPPRKLLVGFSDVTILHHYTHTRWGWHTLHAAMPGQLVFPRIAPAQLGPTLALARGEHPGDLFAGHRLRFLFNPPDTTIIGPVRGGNLATWNYLTGTPLQPRDLAGAILFFEDLAEGFYKMDAYFNQLSQNGGLDGVAAIVLGGFHECDDSPGTALDRPLSGDELTAVLRDGTSSFKTKPLRPTLSEDEAMRRILEPLADQHSFTVAAKLPVGHGPDYAPLPLNTGYDLTPEGELRLKNWGWPGRASR